MANPLGEVRLQGLPNGDGVVTLPFTTAGQEYTLVLEATTPNASGNAVRVLGSEGAVLRDLTPAAAPESPVPGEAYIRRMERELLSGLPRGAAAPARRGLEAADDDEEQFWIVNKSSSISLTDPTNFDQILATRRYNGTHVEIYVDQRATASLSDAAILAMGQRFDTQTYDIDVNAFGSPSDIDNNGKVIILLSPTVNALTTPEIQAEGARIIGFFFGIDLLPNPSFNPHANGREIFYAVVPNENQEFAGARVTNAEVVDLLGSVFAHEFQHMINFNEHFFERNGQPEVTWLDEGLAHMAETLNGYHFQNRLRSAFFLDSPSEVSLVGEGDGLDERGAAWLFVQYLVDRFGASVLGRLVQTSQVSTSNVGTATGQPFTILFHQWANTLLLDGPQTPNDAIYEMTSLDLRPEFDLAKQLLGDRVPGTYLDRRPITGQGSSVAVLHKGTSPLYVTVTGSGESNVLITIDGQSSAGLQVSIVRTK